MGKGGGAAAAGGESLKLSTGPPIVDAHVDETRDINVRHLFLASGIGDGQQLVQQHRLGGVDDGSPQRVQRRGLADRQDA